MSASNWTRSMLTAAVSAGIVFTSGCGGELGREFREATRDEFEAGVNALLDGVVQGAFELYDPDEESSSP